MGRIILASGSPRRQWLLRQIGLEPEVVVSQVEELMTDKEPDWMVRNLALRKAEDVAAYNHRLGVDRPFLVRLVSASCGDWSRYGGGCGWENPGEACLGL